MSDEDDDDVTDMWRQIMMTAMLVCDDEDGNDYKVVGRFKEVYLKMSRSGLNEATLEE